MTEETQQRNENPSDAPTAPEELPRQIFRQEAVDYLYSTEQLDRAMRLLRPMDWLTLAGFGTMVIFSLLWGIFGKIPITVSGRGGISASDRQEQNRNSDRSSFSGSVRQSAS